MMRSALYEHRSTKGSDKVVGGDALEHLVLATRGRLSAAALAKVKAAGAPLEGKVAATYPAAALAQCVRAMAEDLYPSLEPTEAHRRLAHLRVEHVAQSLKGRVLFALGQLAPRERALERFVRAMRDGASYIDARFTVLAPRHYEVWISDVTGLPGYFWGMLEAGWRHSCRDPEPMSIKAREGESCTYEVKREVGPSTTGGPNGL